MTKKQLIPWVAGLFEGEGSFGILNDNKPKAVTITSTDLDILQRIESFFGGKIYPYKSHVEKGWKQAYVWTIRGRESWEFVQIILPFLGKRRTLRAKYYLSLLELKENQKKVIKDGFVKRNLEILLMYQSGKTHKEIADKFKMERSSITHLLSKMV